MENISKYLPDGACWRLLAPDEEFSWAVAAERYEQLYAELTLQTAA